jgi:hypothetical protein
MRVSKVCENCGREYEGSPQSRFHSDSCRKAYARKADESLPERQLDEEDVPELGRPLRVLLKLDPYAELSEPEEQAIKDHFGYASSERRTRAERQRVADAIIAKAGPLDPKVKRAMDQIQDEHRRHLEKVKAYLDSLKVPSPAG